MPHPIFQIDELLRLVIDELVKTSRQSAVSLALTCRSLEEPTLSSLWKEQSSLLCLIAVLPNTFRVECSSLSDAVEIEGEPSAKDWSRLQRYASWMPGLDITNECTPSAGTLSRLSRGSPDGLLFPKLEWLNCVLDYADNALSFFRLFLSPHLRRIKFYTYLCDLAAFSQIIPALPTSLESLDVELDPKDAEHAKDALSSFVCRCGSSLRSLGIRGLLSDAATLHLIQLPNLTRWMTDQGPPQVTSTPVLRSLEHFHFKGEAILPWLRFLASDGKGTREGLKFLDLPHGTVIDSTFLFPIVNLRNLVKLLVHNKDCGTEESCSFHLTDDNVEDLAAALPRLESLRLGHPCSRNTCKTTVASLMSISIHCLDLLILETHFNTQTIVDDMQSLLNGGVGHNKAKCRLWRILVGYQPLELDSADLRTIAMGFSVIFPRMVQLVGYHWIGLRRRIPGVSVYYDEADAVVR